MSHSDSSDVSDIDCSDLEKMKAEMLALKRKIKRLEKLIGSISIEIRPPSIKEFIYQKLIGREFLSKEGEDKEYFVNRIGNEVKSVLEPYHITTELSNGYRKDTYWFHINDGELCLVFELNRHVIGKNTLYTILIESLDV